MPAALHLADLTWMEAEKALSSSRLLVIPLGASAKEHGPHLRLDNDLRLAEALAARVACQEDILIAPSVGFHFYPAFVDYPGSTSLRPETARDLLVDVCRSWARHGAQRQYVLNTGLSTRRPLAAAAEVLGADNITLTFTDFSKSLREAEARLGEQEGGSHADETETSLMLALAPSRVDMDRAALDFHPRTPGERFVRTRDAKGTFSASGVWGNPTLASAEKGEAFADAVVAAVCADLAALRLQS